MPKLYVVVVLGAVLSLAVGVMIVIHLTEGSGAQESPALPSFRAEVGLSGTDFGVAFSERYEIRYESPDRLEIMGVGEWVLRGRSSLPYSSTVILENEVWERLATDTWERRPSTLVAPIRAKTIDPFGSLSEFGQYSDDLVFVFGLRVVVLPAPVEFAELSETASDGSQIVVRRIADPSFGQRVATEAPNQLSEDQQRNIELYRDASALFELTLDANGRPRRLHGWITGPNVQHEIDFVVLSYDPEIRVGAPVAN